MSWECHLKNMKSDMPLEEFRKITISHYNKYTLLICLYRPIECLFEPSVMYFNLFYVN